MNTSASQETRQETRQESGTLERALASSREEVASLKKQVLLLNQIVDALPAMIGYVDLNEQIVFANKHIEHWYLKDRGTLTGMELKELFSDEHYRTVQDSLRQVLSGKVVNKESEITYPDGVRRHVYLDYIPDTVDQSVRGYFFLVRDISKRKLAEQRLKVSNRSLDQKIKMATAELEATNRDLRAEINVRKQTEEKLRSSQESLFEALESMTDGFMLFNSEGLLVAYNQKIRELYPSVGEELKPGAKFKDLIRLSAQESDVKEAIGRVEEWVELRMRDYPSATGSVEVQLTDGRWILATDRPTRSQGVVGLRTDITERKQYEEKVRVQQEQMASVLRRASMGEMASALAHEISQPLAAIANYSRGSILRLQSQTNSHPEVIAALEKSIAEAERAKSIISQVGNFVRQSTPEVSDCLLSTLVAGVLELAAVSIKRNGIQCDTNMPATPVTISINLIEMEQVLFNLIRNSIDSLKQCAESNRRIQITAELTPLNHCRIAVTDNGIGIADAIREKVFQPYVTSKDAGLGMGLSISRTIIESHGGSIWIDKYSDETTRVVFTLPDARAATPK